MDLLGGGSKSMQAGRLFAVLWLLCASFAMQIIAVGQGISARLSAEAQTGDVSAPDTGSSNHPAARQISRAVPLSDLRFTGERRDVKSASGGDLSPALPIALAFEFSDENRGPVSVLRANPAFRLAEQGQRIRAPPLA